MSNTSNSVKITKAQKLVSLGKLVEQIKDNYEVFNEVGIDHTPTTLDILLEFIEHEQELLSKKASKSKKTSSENEALMAQIAEAFKEISSPVTVTQFQDKVEGFSRLKYSNQKITSLFRAMVENDILVKTTDKRTSYFALK